MDQDQEIKLHHEQEFVIGGFTKPEGSRKYFGALLVGFYEGKNLRFGGSLRPALVSDKLLRSLYSELQKIRVDRSINLPFITSRRSARSRWDQGLTAAEMRRAQWVKPVMVCQVKFTEWTRDDRLRQPVFSSFWESGKTRWRMKWSGRRRANGDREVESSYGSATPVELLLGDVQETKADNQQSTRGDDLLRAGRRFGSAREEKIFRGGQSPGKGIERPPVAPA